ncbi:P-loop containing nucleoside triphosphate hydrolase protein [Polychytrium aggregatum]|uniref:P-loop containing nucleoside triphosphate hydrolase protein n=1 Tax=Polychytrium aggregatum TaxID=110093 RepID=UPI0022FEF978|nr:P-loop containing nucleoside triphosphate hydrolase protein [Polychytrium aggregatum]KAI9202166.1 P-loop containing nucleoside triphosphate hydrolase protein [Polychytrium aggregatum]
MSQPQSKGTKAAMGYHPTTIGTRSPNPLGFLFLSWLLPLLRLGASRPLVFEDLYSMKPKSRASSLSQALEASLRAAPGAADASQPPSKTAYSRAFMKSFLPRWFLGFAFSATGMLATVAIPLLMRQIVLNLSGQPTFVQNPYGLAFLMFGCTLAAAVCAATSTQIMTGIAIDVRTSLIGLIYQKALRLSVKASKKFDEGAQLVFVNVDSQAVYDTIIYFDSCINTTVQIALVIYFIYTLIGHYILISVYVMLGALVLLAACTVFLTQSQKKMLANNDDRLNLIREVFMNIKMIKLRGWELIFESKIDVIREKMMRGVAGYLISILFLIAVIISVPLLLPTVTFAIYSMSGNPMRPEVVFPAMTYFIMLIEPLNTLPFSYGKFAQGLVSWNRLVAFFNAEESSGDSAPLLAADVSTNISAAIALKDCTFRWETSEEPSTKDDAKKSFGFKKSKRDPKEELVHDSSLDSPSTQGADDAPATKTAFSFEGLDVEIARGSLTAIVGRVGSGKSSLLTAVSGQMTKVQGTVHVNGKLAYCSQQPWIQAASIRANIQFVSPEYDEKRMAEVITACGLEADMAQLAGGIDTQIGEKGINLSGGQNARVALARAVYSDADIYLLDDPLAALDSHVGKHVFDKCIGPKGMLSSKTRVLVTHQLHVLPSVDRIIVFDNGRIVESGSYSELLAKPEGHLKEMVQDHKFDSDDEQEQEDTKAAQSKETKEKTEAGEAKDLIEEEEIEIGEVQRKTYVDYFKYSGGYWTISAMAFFLLVFMGFSVACQLFLNYWTTDSLGYSQDTYRLMYIILSVVETVGLIIYCFAGGFNSIVGSRKIHKLVIKKLLNSPMHFFETQPLGRILNRLSKDIEMLDQYLWNIVQNVFLVAVLVLNDFIITAYATPWIIIELVILSVAVYYIFKFYRASVRQLKRLDSNMRSPLYAFISESFSGVSVIRAFHAQETFIERQHRLIDDSNAPFYLNQLCAIWLRVWIASSMSLITLGTILLAIGTKVPPSTVALALSCAVDIPNQLINFGQTFSLFEQGMNTIERLVHYIENIDGEAPRKCEAVDPPSEWPSKGEIQIKDLAVAYPSHPDRLVLKNLSLEIKAGEKIGVVGRTGSGKSTLLTVLFRLLDPVGGEITIDGFKTGNIGLHTLRQRLQIIPQEPILFSGTIRSNIDIEGKFDDAEIWESIGFVGLTDYISSLPEKLDSAVTTGGQNLSVGQRQLLCLARAIICKPKILVMDEASSAVDAMADTLIQKAIKSNFADSTVISIAHRLNTIADFDRIIVLDAGNIAEMGTPHELLAKEGGLFAEMANATGPSNVLRLQEVAAQHSHSTLNEL